MMRAPRAAIAALCLLTASSAAAQIAEPNTTGARVRIGPLALNPAFELLNLGIDTNVFNEPGDQKKRDFTFTVAPRTDAFLKVGRAWLTGNIREEILWYQKYDSERAANTTGTLGVLVPLNRVSASANVGYLNAKDRPGFEIDARARRRETSVGGAVEVRALARTFFGVQGNRRIVKFDQGATFLNVDLREELDRTTTEAGVIVRHQLTPLTSISFDAGRSEDRFAFSSLRDSTSTTAGVQVTFDPAALIKGSARVGYRSFKPDAPTVTRYEGSVAAVKLSYVPLPTTKFDFQASRDVQYSIDINQPYYLQTGFGTSIAQQIFGPVDAVAGLSRFHLAYRERLDVLALLAERTDTVRTYHGGIGYHVGPALRIGVRVEKQERVSPVPQRAYEDLRIGMSITYGT
jgi:hypothetical protein